eukprot:44570-Pelagomonas_calceolata.AAC.3
MFPVRLPCLTGAEEAALAQVGNADIHPYYPSSKAFLFQLAFEQLCNPFLVFPYFDLGLPCRVSLHHLPRKEGLHFLGHCTVADISARYRCSHLCCAKALLLTLIAARTSAVPKRCC